MKIDHVAMYVRDLEVVKDFFVRFFGAVSNEMYHNPRTGLKSYFLSFGNGAKLEIMTRPGYIHLSFSVGSEERVNSPTAKLQSAGYEVISGPRFTGDGFYESCVLDSEHNQIEITV